MLEDRNLTAEQWRQKTQGMNELGRAMYEKYGVRAQYHPHADSHVDTGRTSTGSWTAPMANS